jgi:carboxyl-terminal processing protease
MLEIDGKSTKGKSVNDVSQLLKGQPGTDVTILIQRPGVDKPFNKTLTRARVQVENVPFYGMAGDGIGYINLSAFKENASQDIAKALHELKKQNQLKGLILDLRGNPGGLLNESVNVSGLFLNSGEFVVSTKGKADQWNKEFKTSDNPIDINIPLVVLVNGSSASASEIVAGALQDLDRAVIIGERTFGKGLVQATRSLSYNASLKVTTAKYYIPSGRCIQALDYSHKDDQGRAIKVADSLITEFKTRNGRPVFDGKGILPDITVKDSSVAEIVKALISDNLIFDYATNYRSAHDSIPPADKFSLTDAEYQDFVNFVLEKKLNYKPPTERAMANLEKESKADKYFNDIKPYYDSISVILARNKNRDLLVYKKDILEYLEEEIISRYYFQKGRILYKMHHSDQVFKAVEILNNAEAYRKILQPDMLKK